jgi:transcriptional regulator with XRE-family HTH domain/predicted GIY-YIG superfamily endonuclease
LAHPEGRTALYRFFDADGTLLYVGITNDTGARWKQHSKNAEWWPQVAANTVEWHPTRMEAADAESCAIKEERPIHNLNGVRWRDRTARGVPRSANPIGPTGTTVGENIARLRAERRISTLKLALLLNGAGRRITASAISKIEGGTRRVDADDLVAFAAALNVNPSALLLPPVADGTIEVSGVGPVDSGTAWDWVDGKGPLFDLDDEFVRLSFQLHARPPGRRNPHPA